MKAVILDGSKPGDASSKRILGTLLDTLEANGWGPIPYPLASRDIGPCRGCFGCWLQKPGLCLLEDDGQELAAAVIGSDLTVFFTPVTFGGYSSELKKGLDRLIGLILPFFVKISGEIHHQARYEKYPFLLGVGVLAAQGQRCGEIFSTLVKRNAINFHAPGYAVTLVGEDQEERSINEDIKDALAELGEKR